MEVNDAHVLLGHIGKTLLEQSAKLISWELTGTLTTRDARAKAKAQAKGVTKKALEPASKPGESRHTVKYVRCNNAGENTKQLR